MLRRIVILVAAAVITSGCEVYHEQLTPNYELYATDTIEQVALWHCRDPSSVGVGVVPATVTAIAASDRYILARRTLVDLPDRTGVSFVEYYIVVIPEDPASYPYDGIHGPLTREQFDAKRLELGVPESLVLRDLV